MDVCEGITPRIRAFEYPQRRYLIACALRDTVEQWHISWFYIIYTLDPRPSSPYTLQVQDDIMAQLQMQDPLRLVSSMNRPNIRYSVRFTDLLKDQARSNCPRACRELHIDP